MSEDEENITTKKRRIIVGIVLLILVIIIIFSISHSRQLNGYLDECPYAVYENTETCKQQAQDIGVSGMTDHEVKSQLSNSNLFTIMMGFVFITVSLYEILPTLYRRTDYYKRRMESKKKEAEIQKQQFAEMSSRSPQKHNGAMGEDEITRLKSIADLRDSGVLTDDEFQEQKSRILAESTGVSSNQTHFSGEGEPPMEDNSRYLFYILSFLIPLAGVIIGIIYHGKPEPWHKEFGKKCLELALTAIAIVFIIGLLSILSILML
tara:strand:- start:37 stop:828 length:792 start_codon:yes stop_codon:yes gene_type:complete